MAKKIPLLLSCAALFVFGKKANAVMYCGGPAEMRRAAHNRAQFYCPGKADVNCAMIVGNEITIWTKYYEIHGHRRDGMAIPGQDEQGIMIGECEVEEPTLADDTPWTEINEGSNP